jgi:hypothetical protein
MHATLPITPVGPDLRQTANGFSQTIPGSIGLTVPALGSLYERRMASRSRTLALWSAGEEVRRDRHL